jgi:hypothetical protein
MGREIEYGQGMRVFLMKKKEEIREKAQTQIGHFWLLVP